MYLSANLKDLIPNEKLYGPTIVNIPAPRFFVFYNGITSMKDKVTYRLSDMFAKKVESPSVELTVTALNINSGHNKELMELLFRQKCALCCAFREKVIQE